MPAARHRLGLDCKVNDAFEPVVADGELPEAQGVDGGVQRAHGLEGLAQRANDDGGALRIGRIRRARRRRRREPGRALFGMFPAEDELLRGLGVLWTAGARKALTVVDLRNKVCIHRNLPRTIQRSLPRGYTGLGKDLITAPALQHSVALQFLLFALYNSYELNYF